MLHGKKPTLLLIESESSLRRLIALGLQDQGIYVVEASEPTTIPSFDTQQLDLVVMDVSLPGKNGIDILKVLREEFPRLKVLIVSMYPEDQYAVRAFRAGAAGYLNKASAPEKLVEAISQVIAGRKYVTPEIAQALIENLNAPQEGAAHDKLSDREFQTLRLIASGKRLSDIAEELALSPKTVSVYRARILEKMGMSNNAELTHYAIKNGLVE